MKSLLTLKSEYQSKVKDLLEIFGTIWYMNNVYTGTPNHCIPLKHVFEAPSYNREKNTTVFYLPQHSK